MSAVFNAFWKTLFGVTSAKRAYASYHDVPVFIAAAISNWIAE